MSSDLAAGFGFGGAAGTSDAAGFGGGGAALADTTGSAEGIGVSAGALGGGGTGATDALGGVGEAVDGGGVGTLFASTEMIANVASTPRSAATTAVAITALLDRLGGTPAAGR
jgi:hypothetical protein